MKYIFIYLILYILAVPATAQNRKLDSLQAAYGKTTTDTARAMVLLHMAAEYYQNHPDSELLKAQQALFFSREKKFIKGEKLALKQMAEAYQTMSNYPLALNYYLQRLKLDEQNPDPEMEVVTMLSIANLYELEGDYTQALVYAKKAYALIGNNKLEGYRWYSYIGFGDLYEKANNIVQAKHYSQLAYELALKEKDSGWVGMSLNNLGNAYLKDKVYPQAESFYRQGIPYLQQDENTGFLCESYQGLATILFQSSQHDSAVYYAKKSLQVALNSSLSNHYIQACQLLTNFYTTDKKADSALAYQGKLIVMKDSIYSQEKVRQVENLTFSERLRQQEREQEQLAEAKDRSYKLKMLLIGIFIPLSFLISLLLSKRKIKPRIVEFSGILSLLLLFEYLTLLLHPMISNLTDHSPFLEIIILVMIAAVLTPTHHRLEQWMLHQLTHKAHEKKAAVTETAVAENTGQAPAK